MEALGQLLRRARQRVIGNLIIEQASLGLTLGLACGVLLLILGTQILNWYWPVLLFALAFGIGVARFWRKLPGDYRIAQLLDARLALPDTLSTAWHFQHAPPREADAAMRELQLARAVEAAGTADVALALPYRASRLTMAALAALGVFSALMLYRYGSQSRLDLSQPLVPGLVDLFGSSNPGPLASLGKKMPDGATPDANDTPAATAEERQQEEAQALDEAPEDVLKTIGVPEVDNSAAEPVKGDGPQKEGGSEGQDDAQGDQGEKSAGGEANKDSQGGSKDGSKDGNKPDGQKAQQQGGENNSLMEKFRDAMANLMNKVKQPGKQGGDQMAKNQKQDGQGQGKGEGAKQGDKGAPQQGKPNAEGGDGDQKGDQEAEGGDQQQQAKGKGSSDSNQPKGSDDPKSGMGSQDGAKDVRLAEQLQAMGKLSEIIGKRSEKQTGEMMVEVSSGKNQQLKTAYSSKSGQHADTGGEIHRDEVPLVYQQYVQSYFEQIRRTAPVAPPPAKPAPTRP